ncbi:MAG: SAM-dependent methyltransferase, partial [Cyanobacteriota bacterium]|nr:SAM-dependent methyltransferase [Cyanobacteriota bacterium]
HPACPVRVIPGITSVAAAAAVASGRGQAGELAMPWPLALQGEGLLIRPTPESTTELERLLDWAAGTGAGGGAETAAQTTLALLKLGHRWSWVRPLLEQRGLLDRALFAQRVGWPEQLLAPASQVPVSEQPYFSLLLVRQGWPQVLP